MEPEEKKLEEEAEAEAKEEYKFPEEVTQKEQEPTGKSVSFRLLLSTCRVPRTFCVFILSSSVRQSRCFDMSWRYLRMSIFWAEYSVGFHILPKS